MDNRFAWCVSSVPVRLRAIDPRDLYRRAPHPPLKDYGSAVAAAIAWLGNRYLLARPVNALRADSAAKSLRRLAAPREARGGGGVASPGHCGQ
jgi:hypothetical protein